MREEPLIEADELLIERTHDGDERALDALLHRYRSYARAKARSYFLAGADREDIVQEGMIGLFKAIRDYAHGRNTSFRAFAELCIERQIITAIKAASRHKHMPLNSYVSLNQVSALDDGSGSSLTESLVAPTDPDPVELVISAEELSRIRGSISRLLSQFELEVLTLYMEGRSYQEIADFVGRHAKSIDNALQRIKRKLEPHILSRQR